MTLAEARRAIRPLLDENSPADATAVYYAFHHPDERTRILTHPEGAARPSAYLCLSQTGMDLFRPLITLRLPDDAVSQGPDPAAGAALLHRALRPGAGAIITAPIAYRALLQAVFTVQQEQDLTIMVLDRGHFQPLINVLVAQAESYNNLPRFVIRQTPPGNAPERGDVVAASGLNWQSDRFADVYVNTQAPFRRQGLGQSVLAYAVQHVLDRGRVPTYAVATDNEPSIRLAESVGFVDLGIRKVLLEGTLKPLPG
jgi:GNAT superfamily N-acetyltransferase